MPHRCAALVGIFSLGLLLGACGSSSPGSNDGGGGRGGGSGGASVDAAAGRGSAGGSGSAGASGAGGARGSDAATDADACPRLTPSVQLVDGGFVEQSCTSAGQVCDYHSSFCKCGPPLEPTRSEAGGLVWSCSPII